jgi:hypothetical protein
MGVLRLLAAVTLTFTLCSNAAAIAIIDFEGVAPVGGALIPATPYMEDGFTISSIPPGAYEGIFDATSSQNTNGTDIFGWCADCGQGPGIITLAESSGQLFDLLSFDYALLLAGGLTQGISVTGYLNGGGTVNTTVSLSNIWTTSVLSGFIGLTHVDFIGTVLPGPDLAMDNLVVSLASTSVPAPTVLGLMIIGLIGVGAATKRRNELN